MDLEIEIKNINKSIDSCDKCNLYKSKKNYVHGFGALDSNIFLIGEAPGYNEDVKGIPFVGKAGKILDKLLFSIDMERNDVYITNILKCRPPNNRNPLKNEINSCAKYLNEEINLIKPKIISPLGNYASNFIFNKFNLKFEKISFSHGNIYPVDVGYDKLNIIPQYHPAVAVYNQNMIETLINDFKIVKKFLK
jgi:DNA polymerase